MSENEPIAFFITWTVYGTYLQGAENGWRRRCKGAQLPQADLVAWRRDRLKHDVLSLTPDQREVVESECRRHCEHRNWKVWEVNSRSNHVHVIVTAPGVSGGIVRDQLKANCTRGLRETWPVFRDRPFGPREAIGNASIGMTISSLCANTSAKPKTARVRHEFSSSKHRIRRCENQTACAGTQYRRTE